ncbi:MAG: threonine/serine dehydratase [Planctomycetota bacterium]|nr:threonine/serine dehydratase [Planctomycetota bacterium]
MKGALPVTPDEIVGAHRRLHGVCHRTLMFTCSALDREAGCRTLLKGENFQRIGAFKLRGAYNFVAQMSAAARAKGIVAASSGNHGQGVARAGKLFGSRVTIVVPEDTVPTKREAIERDGAEIVVAGTTSNVRLEEAQRIAEETGATFIHAFDHPWVIAGQGTVGKEIIEDAPHIDALLIPVGGGGLIAGCAVAARARNPRIKIFGVEPEGADSMRQSLKAKKPVRIDATDTIADGLRPVEPGHIPYQICAALLDGVVTVTDAEIAEGVRFLLARAKVLVEPSGAAGIAALLYRRLVDVPGTVATVLTGGNADFDVLARILRKEI